MTTLPDTVERYAQTRRFTETTTPDNLQKNHTTRPGVWGKLIVVSGALGFAWEGAEDLTLAPGDAVIIPPETPHRVTLIGAVEYYVEFYR